MTNPAPAPWIEPLTDSPSLLAAVAYVCGVHEPARRAALAEQLGLAAPRAAPGGLTRAVAACAATRAAADEDNPADFIASADAVGLRLRELHPPAAAEGLDNSREFELHFEDSYVPLIRRALGVGQTALAWCGWEEPTDRRWGVVVADGEPLRGYAVGCGGRLIELVGPALQVYIVEEVNVVRL